MLYSPNPVCEVLALDQVAGDAEEPEVGVVHRLGLKTLDPGLRDVLVLQERQNGDAGAGGGRSEP